MNALQKLFNWFKKRKIVPARLENLIIRREPDNYFDITLSDSDGKTIYHSTAHIAENDTLNIDFIPEQ